MTHQIIYKGIRDTNTFCKNCLKPRMFTKRNTMCECGARACLVNLPLKTNLKYPSYKLGVELEGTWFDEPLDANIMQREDGSVEYHGDDDDSRWHTGEYVFADPMNILPFKNWESVIRNCYPDDVNRTCGGHFHTSWTDMRFYSILMDQEFAWECVDHMRNWAVEENQYGRTNLNSTGQERLFNRLDGHEDYTKMRLEPELQIHGSGDRYTFFNFPYEKHTTIECRFLPQFEQPDTYIKAVHEILGFMENWVRMKCGAKDRNGKKNWHNERTNTKVTFKGQISQDQVRKHLRKQFNFTSEDCDWAENQV